jgi:glycosyltransferase involved in cell wall biosynthesis
MQISVIVPVYTVEKYIERCIRSILNQTFQDFEIIVVNDATPDNSMEIVQKYAKSDSRIKVFENSLNMGPMWTRRESYRRAVGDYFVFVDSDDYLPENALEILYNTITEEKVDIVAGSFQAVSKKGKGHIVRPKLSYGTDLVSVYKSLLRSELPHSLWGKIYDRKLFENHDYETFLNQTHGEDAILFYQIISRIKELKIVDKVVYYYYCNEKSASNSQLTDDRYKAVLFAMSYTCNYLKNMESLSYILRESKIRRLLYMLKNGYKKNSIHKWLIWSDIEQLSRFKILSLHYSGLSLFWNYTIMHSKIARSLAWFINKIYWKLRLLIHS